MIVVERMKEDIICFVLVVWSRRCDVDVPLCLRCLALL